jgi:hypothetical protein
MFSKTKEAAENEKENEATLKLKRDQKVAFSLSSLETVHLQTEIEALKALRRKYRRSLMQPK